jgi:pimeloyl-ACP methyl ester carboxylesterase
MRAYSAAPAAAAALEPRARSPAARRARRVVDAAAAAPRRALFDALRSPAARRARRIAAAAAAAGPRRALFDALLDAARREALPAARDLLDPLLGRGAPAGALPPTVAPEALADDDSRFVTVDGLRVHYKEAAAPAASSSSSSADAPTIVMIHGLNGSTFSWRHILRDLSHRTGLRGIAFDRPPFGLTERPEAFGGVGDALAYDPYSNAGAARLLESLLAALGAHGPVVLVGHSAGAIVSMEFHARRPERVAGLALVAPALPTTPANDFARRATFGTQLRLVATRATLASDAAGLAYVRRQLLRRADEVAAGGLGIALRAGEDTEAVAEGYLKPIRAHGWDSGYLQMMRAFSLGGAFDYGEVAAPALVLGGAQDEGLRGGVLALGELLAARQDAATRRVELDCGHSPMDERPEELVDALAEFIADAVLGSSSSSE